MTNYVSRFIDNYSTISESLRRLTQKDKQFEWTSLQANAFNLLKNAVVNDSVFTYFDPTKCTELKVDASSADIPAILIQQNNVVSYGTRSFSLAEQRYSPTGREALECMCGCQHFLSPVFVWEAVDSNHG